MPPALRLKYFFEYIMKYLILIIWIYVTSGALIRFIFQMPREFCFFWVSWKSVWWSFKRRDECWEFVMLGYEAIR